MNTDEESLNRSTEKGIGCAYRVGNRLGHGFLEKCYENALAHELKKVGLTVRQQVASNVWYDGVVVGKYFADLIVEGVLLVELKAIESLALIQSAQCINYLTPAGIPLYLLINFDGMVDVKRLAGLGFDTRQGS